MKTIALPVLRTLRGLFQSRARLHLEILALRKQLAMVNQAPRKRLRFHWGQRLCWIWLYRLWPGCLQTLQVFKPDTLVRWHRKGFRLYWTWKSRCRIGGRPAIAPEVRELIRTMSRDNIGWGAPRIHGELQMLGIHLSQATVAKYMVRHPKPSQTWRTFLDSHSKDLVSVDYFTVPTATFRILYVWGQRLFWICLYRLWPDCLQTLRIFKPDTLVRWHRKGFRLYWTWKSRCRRGGRPPISPEVRKLIRTMSQDNIGWGAPRIHGELQMLGIEVCQATVAKYMAHHPRPPSQTWRRFLDNHIKDLVSVDFFTVPTATFRILYVFLVLRHDRREVVHFNVTEHPTAQWTAQQMVEAFPWDPAHQYLLRDRDKIFGAIFRHRVHSLDMREVLIAPRSPWQNPYVERLIGSIRRECLNYVILFNELHLKKMLRAYLIHYHQARTHLALDKQCPEPRSVELPDQGTVIAFPHVGGLHHEYRRAA